MFKGNPSLAKLIGSFAQGKWFPKIIKEWPKPPMGSFEPREYQKNPN